MKKTRNLLIWFLCTGIFALILLYGLSKTPTNLPGFDLSTAAGKESIRVYTGEQGNLYVFLPSYAEMEQVTITSVSGRTVLLGDTPVSDGQSCGTFQTQTPYPLTINGRKCGTLWFCKSENVASIHIDTGSGNMAKIHADKNTAEIASIRVFTDNGELNYSNQNITLKGRGNSSWTLEKKPYAINLDQAGQILGLGDASQWVLLANYTDDTNLRNNLVFDCAKAAGSYAGFSPDCLPVDLYLNGQYNGQYLLCRKITASADYLDSGDYLFELMWSGRTTSTTNIFSVSENRCVEVLYPENCTGNQSAVLQTYLAQFLEALSSPDGICQSTQKKWSDYIDIDSWARKYLVEEIFSNFDAGQASQYFWLDSQTGKIYAGPCWDYDLTFGKQWQTTWYSAQSLLARRDWGNDRSWFSMLWDQAEFRQCVTSLYTDRFRPILEQTCNTGISDAAAKLSASTAMDRLRWPATATIPYDEAVGQLSAFLNARIAFLDAIWINQEPYCAITLQTKETYNIYVPYNTICADLPLPEELNASGVWYVQQTGQPFDPESPICENITLVVKKSATGTQTDSPSLKVLVILASLAALFLLFLCLAAVDFCRRRKERRLANERSRTSLPS